MAKNPKLVAIEVALRNHGKHSLSKLMKVGENVFVPQLTDVFKGKKKHFVGTQW